MITFSTILQKLTAKDEKYGWTVVPITAKIAQQLKPNNKKSFRVKGTIDNYAVQGIALMPMGNGEFVMPLNAKIRKGIKKIHGAKVLLQLEEDNSPIILNTDLLECLQDEPSALAFFNTLTPSHKKYFSNWVNTAKTEATKAKRIAACINALAKKWDYGLMIRTGTAERKKLSN
jgi:Bacteriocin-protection, YdeI or OmpD-Associated/Domain of unknown function (DUF1905)